MRSRPCEHRLKRHASIPLGLLNCDEVYARGMGSPFLVALLSVDPLRASVHSKAKRERNGLSGDAAEAASYRARNRRKAGPQYSRTLPKPDLL